MSISPLTTTGTEIKGSLYLPSIGFGFLLISISPDSAPQLSVIGQEISLFLLAFIFTLVTAVISHEFIESYSGPSTGLLESVPPGRTYQSIAFTLYRIGEPTDYPKRPDVPPWRYDVDIPPSRHISVNIAVFAFLVFLLSYPYTTFELAKYSVQNSSLVPGAVAFAEAVFMLRYFLSDFWPKTYRYWELKDESDT